MYNLLKSQIEEFGISVVPSDCLGNYYHPVDSTIHMLDNDVYALAHEFGHHVIWSASPKWAGKRSDLLFDISEGFISPTEYIEWEKIDETLAWGIAYLVLKQVFGEEISIKDFEKNTSPLLGSYKVEDTSLRSILLVLQSTLTEVELNKCFELVSKVSSP
jgi:hypothetical protein